ncbi:MAG: polysaccharide deacetylase family protein [Hyphomicrobiaceae bacterium]
MMSTTSATAAGDKSATCGPDALGVERIVEIDTRSGPLFGRITRQQNEQRFLRPKEVVLTFDDGPMPWITRAILDTLDSHCAKATFFSVGRMAMAYPATLRDVVSRGHTLGSHTWSHPLNMRRLKSDKARDEFERGFAALSLASGGNLSPFFRFPGLSDSPKLLDSLQQRGVAAFSVDVVSDDSFISSPAKLARVTLDRIEAENGGIVLFHDIKPATAKALPVILAELKERGFRVVHLRSKEMLKPLPEFADELQPKLVKADPPQGRSAMRAAMLPFFGAIGPERVAHAAAATAQEQVAVETLSPAARERLGAGRETSTEAPAVSRGAAKRRRSAERSEHAARTSTGSGWSTEIRRQRFNRTLFD